MPAQLKVAISVGIGLFIALIGLVDAGLRAPHAAPPTTTVPVSLGSDGQLQGWPVAVFVLRPRCCCSPCTRAGSAAPS